MQPECAIFRQKISKIFWGGGIAPSRNPTPNPTIGAGNTPDQTPHPLGVCGASPRLHPNCFPNFYHYDTVIDEFGKSNRGYSFVSRPRAIKWNAFRRTS